MAFLELTLIPPCVACREAESTREKEVRKGLLVIATKAALAEQELHVNSLQADAQRLGSLTVGISGHMGEPHIYTFACAQPTGFMHEQIVGFGPSRLCEHGSPWGGSKQDLKLCRGVGLREEWEDGPAFQAVRKKQKDLAQQRERIESCRKVALAQTCLPRLP